MQLNKRGKISGALAVASQVLLNPTVQAKEEITAAEWDYDTAIMYYGEDDSRVSALEGMVGATRTNGDDQTLSLKLTVDSLTGASPTGAVPQNEAQTFTRPSGNGSYTVAPGDTPLDDTFKDTRVQLNASWASPINRDWDWSTGVHISKEYDYLSLGANIGFSRSLNQNNTVLTMGLGGYFDTIEPEGGIPEPLTAMVLRDNFTSEAAYREAFNATRGESSDTKTTTELNVGISQVINRWLITSLNYSFAQVDGYLTDPFKLISVVDDDGVAQQNLYENRPDSRTKHALFWQTKAYLNGQVLDIGYRYMFDDWEIQSHTIDFRYNYQFGSGHYLEPHLRFYRQSEADFYAPFLMEGQSVPTYASADYRLGKMNTYTVGLKYGMLLNNSQEVSVRLEYYMQQPEDAGFSAPGQLSGLDLYPDVQAVILQLNYHF
ncbi:DUF3570 domain-containing protein [Photobacterium lipolyticum]|uniref:DUF3570 domain-containing protein n=1 Tax=Photobacterium lipolyticum TaxID=266810 RepID=A0A2T3N2M3_9GAMM|nr:DUF3570 domain-containing protein [Photobacterium lipolyticum]PSW06619.1 hypothetical protein C9I89_03520 [Photobacterium lipolyticum]